MKQAINTRTPREIQQARHNYLNASQPYFDALARIAALKPIPPMVLNIKTGEFTQEKPEDLPVETKIKEVIESIKNEFLGPYLKEQQ